MATTTMDSPILEKTRELCQTILDHGDFQEVRRNIEYEALMEKGESLNHKQQQGATLSADEIADFESHRERVLNNPVSRAFLDAQQEMQKVQESVSKYVSKTFELGRLPTDEDLSGGGCGEGCGCH
jgi:cell fate (sporulation/competence/biofilm development) regulator YlbF (YheA/YmcA/DUF963 family)